MQDSKHRYKQVDNIDHFMRFLRAVGMPSVSSFNTFASQLSTPRPSCLTLSTYTTERIYQKSSFAFTCSGERYRLCLI